MNLLQVQNLSKAYGAKTLFDHVQVAVNEGEHVGVIGPNGAGKTTFFRLLAGKDESDAGEIIKKQGLRIGYLEQEANWDLSVAAEKYLSDQCITPLWELKKLGLSLGLEEKHFTCSLSELSGGYRMRIKLLEIIGQEPHLMLLDEPTNFLDLESILALENFLQNYKKAFLLISHDREFLKRTTEYTIEIEGGEITKFPGHIEDYFEQKEELRAMQLAQQANQQVKRQQLQAFVDRFRSKATKARQAQSRLKQLEKMQTIEMKELPVKSRIHIPDPIVTGKEILSLNSADLGYGEKIILKDVNLNLLRGKHLGVVGYNGVGKSTLLKSLAGRIEVLSGEKKLGHNVEVSYFAQHVAEELNLQETILQALQSKAAKDTTAQEILNLAGALLFSGDNLQKKISVLSGGEKARVALGQMLLQKKPVLILDEPTNHLDFDTVEALARALTHFAGTLVVVSHDRNFLKRVADQILEIRNGQVTLYPGSYEDYLWSLEKGMMQFQTQEEIRIQQDEKQNSEVPRFNYKEETKRLQSELKEIARKILKTEEVLQDHQAKQNGLNQELLHLQGVKAAEASKELSRVSTKMLELEDVLLNHMEIQESLTNQLHNLIKQPR